MCKLRCQATDVAGSPVWYPCWFNMFYFLDNNSKQNSIKEIMTEFKDVFKNVFFWQIEFQILCKALKLAGFDSTKCSFNRKILLDRAILSLRITSIYMQHSGWWYLHRHCRYPNPFASSRIALDTFLRLNQLWQNPNISCFQRCQGFKHTIQKRREHSLSNKSWWQLGASKALHKWRALVPESG